MKTSLRFVSSILLLSMLLLAAGMGPAEAKSCESASSSFKGMCLNAKNCVSACSKDGHSGGHCSSLRCYCKTC